MRTKFELIGISVLLLVLLSVCVSAPETGTTTSLSDFGIVQATDVFRLIKEKSTSQCLVDCWTTYEITNPTSSKLDMVLDEKSIWWEFRDNRDRTLRNANVVGGLIEFHLWLEFRRALQMNDSVVDKPAVYNLVSTTPNNS